jgi:hypothetical protein
MFIPDLGSGFFSIPDPGVKKHRISDPAKLCIKQKHFGLSGADPLFPYRDPGAPVHIVTGSAGCREKHDGFIPDPPAWSAFR